ncbi:hypothetical protein VTK56DRAFT_7671 [Thermocarpiscus australiensis]
MSPLRRERKRRDGEQREPDTALFGRRLATHAARTQGSVRDDATSQHTSSSAQQEKLGIKQSALRTAAAATRDAEIPHDGEHDRQTGLLVSPPANITLQLPRVLQQRRSQLRYEPLSRRGKGDKVSESDDARLPGNHVGQSNGHEPRPAGPEYPDRSGATTDLNCYSSMRAFPVNTPSLCGEAISARLIAVGFWSSSTALHFARPAKRVGMFPSLRMFMQAYRSILR